MIPYNTKIFMIHGIGASKASWLLNKLFLERRGYANIHIIEYPASDMELIDSILYVDDKMKQFANKTEQIVVMGQSYGGIIANNLHCSGWNVILGIYMCSPLKRPKIIKYMYENYPVFMTRYVHDKAYHAMEIKQDEIEPPHKYITISTEILDTKFDGIVHYDESFIKEENHIHMKGSNHWTLFLSNKLYRKIFNILKGD